MARWRETPVSSHSSRVLYLIRRSMQCRSCAIFAAPFYLRYLGCIAPLKWHAVSRVKAHTTAPVLSYPASCKKFRRLPNRVCRSFRAILARKSPVSRQFRKIFHRRSKLARCVHRHSRGRDTQRACSCGFQLPARLFHFTFECSGCTSLAAHRVPERQASSVAPATSVLFTANTLVSPPIYLEVNDGTNARAGSG